MRNLKRALSLALASVMVMGLMVVGTGASYVDVSSENNVEAIEVLQEVGVMTGDENGNFNPDALVTRNEMAVVMSNLMDYRVANYKGTSPFTDVQETSPYYDAILWAAETGVTNGTTASTFSPDAPCTRAQLAVFLWRAAGEPKPALAEQQFMDVTDPSAYYYGAVQWAAEKDMWGFGTFAPHAVCTRLDAVFFLWRAAGSPDMEGEFPFADVPFGDGDGHGQPLYRYADQAVLWAVENGVASGTTETTFSPDTPCTRGQIATFLYRAAQAETSAK